MGNIGTWQLLIVAALVLVLFGAKRLPEAARGLGRSLKIFKSETQGLISDDKPAAGSTEQADPPTQRAVEPTPSAQQPSANERVDDPQSRRES